MCMRGVSSDVLISHICIYIKNGSTKSGVTFMN